jgi:two-component system, cell cycle sensor histidine kinase and response regulator CckA
MIQAESRAAETGGNCMAPETSDPALPPPVVNQEARPGEVMRLLSLGLVLMAVAALFFLFGDRLGEQFRLGLLGIFAMVGVFYLFASVIGIIRIAPRSTGNEMARSLLDGAGEGAVVSDERGRIVYANKAYADICGMGSPDTVRSLESVLNGVPEANDALERLNAALGAGLSAVEEFRISHSLSGNRSGLVGTGSVQGR